MNLNYNHNYKEKANSPKEESNYRILPTYEYKTLKIKTHFSEQIQSKYKSKYAINTHNPLLKNYRINKEKSSRKNNHLSIYISDMKKTINNKANKTKTNIKQSNNKRIYQLSSRLNLKNDNKYFICEKLTYNKKDTRYIKTTKELNKEIDNNKQKELNNKLYFKKKEEQNKKYNTTIYSSNINYNVFSKMKAKLNNYNNNLITFIYSMHKKKHILIQKKNNAKEINKSKKKIDEKSKKLYKIHNLIKKSILNIKSSFEAIKSFDKIKMKDNNDNKTYILTTPSLSVDISELKKPKKKSPLIFRLYHPKFKPSIYSSDNEFKSKQDFIKEYAYNSCMGNIVIFLQYMIDMQEIYVQNYYKDLYIKI